MDDFLKGIKLRPTVPNLSDISRIMSEKQDDIDKAVTEIQESRNNYNQEVLQTLKNIESNTAGLNEVVHLLSTNVDKQDEILNLLKEALSISASKNKKEAESRWRKVMNRANQLTTDVENIQKIQGFANTIWQLYQNSIS
ncbi:hypothetical protein [Oceanobacillus oncorhynchi]|uniref:hypothetical protein n=1 Tax=Oceanobacillus oncorhynchi TaxID=545501 RepID=UPI0025A3F16C|nr:hypothetical protein [Oceanobacillus oncorhynchi]MDM8100926.1 hypothetical protein [Oceanobacillus oncorhynchi]